MTNEILNELLIPFRNIHEMGMHMSREVGEACDIMNDNPELTSYERRVYSAYCSFGKGVGYTFGLALGVLGINPTSLEGKLEEKK